MSPAHRVYLDNNATTRVDDRVLEAMMPYFTESYGNSSSMHEWGASAGKAVEQARAQAAAALGALETEIVFTSGGTEGDNMSIRGVLEYFQTRKRHIVTTAVEHPAVLSLCQYLARQGYEVTFLNVDRQGRLDLAELKASLRDDTALVSIMWANNETGVVFPIAEIAQIVKERGIVFHVDAVQAIGKVPVDLKKIPVDLLSISGHKFHAPKGVGVQFVRQGTRLRPLMHGGHHERSRRPGTLNTPGIIGLGLACELAARYLDDEMVRVSGLRDKLEQELLKHIPNTVRNGDPAARVPNTANISFQYIEGEAILLYLNEVGIAASSGSACTSGSLEPSHVLKAMQTPVSDAHGSIRFSLSRFTGETDIDYVVKELPPIISRLREISPFAQSGGSCGVG